MSRWPTRGRQFFVAALLLYFGAASALILFYVDRDRERYQSSTSLGLSNALALGLRADPAPASKNFGETLPDILAAAGLDQRLACLVVVDAAGEKSVWPVPECTQNPENTFLEIGLNIDSQRISVRFALSKAYLSEQVARDVLWLIAATLMPIFLLGIPGALLYQRMVVWPVLAKAEELAEAQRQEGVLAGRLDEQEKVEAELRSAISRAEAGEKSAGESQQQLRDAIEAVPDGFVLYDADDRLIWCNQKYREIYDASAEFIKPGVSFEEIIREGVKRGQYVDAIGQEEEWIEERMQRHRNPSGVMEQQLPDGRWVRVGERVTQDGVTVGFRADVTELKQREEALRQSEEQLRQTIDAALDCIIAIDSDGKIIEFNPGAEETFGHIRKDVIGRQMHELLMPPKFHDAHAAGFSKYPKTGEAPILGQRVEIEGMRADGSYFPAELAINVAPRGDGQIFIGYLRDITDRKTAEEALRQEKERAEIANSAKDHFLAMMSHEIRTPLNGVIGLLGLLDDTPLDSEQEEFVRAARISGEGLLDLINDILDYSKMEADKLELENAVFEIRPLVDSVIDVLSPAAAAKKIELSTNLDSDLPSLLVGDQGRIRQVLLNLGSNAVKFTDEGSVRISLSAAPTDHQNAIALKFEVEDTGIGIPEDKHEDLFREFTTVDPSYSRKFGGTGLGLAISRRLTEMMDGEIGVRSSEGNGSTFWFRVPVEIADGDSGTYEELPEVDPADQPDRTAQRLSILVADDTPTNGLFARKMLEKLGHSVDTVLNGVEAIEAVTARRYDIVFMDISMPEMDGLEATAAIRKLDRPVCDTPIVALTAYAMKGDRDRFIQAGMDDYLSKPIVRTQMLRILVEWAHRRHAHRLHMSGDNPTHKPPTNAALDIDVLEELADQIDHQDLVAVIDSFVDDTAKRLDQLEQARLDKDIETLESTAHAMRSSSATFGATGLAATMGEIEEHFLNGRAAEALKLAENLTANVDEIFAGLRVFVGSRKTD